MTCTGSLWRPSMRCSRRVTSRISFLRRNWGHLLTPWRRKRPNSMRFCPPPTSIPQHSLLSPGNLRYCKICPNFFYHVSNYKPFSDKFIKLNKKFSLLDFNINIILNVCVNTPFRGVFLFVWNMSLVRRNDCILMLFLGCPWFQEQCYQRSTIWAGSSLQSKMEWKILQHTNSFSSFKITSNL